MLSILFIHLVALATPGPDFLFISQTAIKYNRKTAIYGAIGITLGVVVWVALVALGFMVILNKYPYITNIIMLLGGSYLCYIGKSLLLSKGATNPTTDSAQLTNPQDALKNIVKGLLINLSNPKVIIYFSSIFALIIPKFNDIHQLIFLCICICIETLCYFIFVASLFSTQKIQNLYFSYSKIIDISAGVIFAGFGITLLYEAISYFFS